MISLNDCNIDEEMDESIDWDKFQSAKYSDDGTEVYFYFNDPIDEQAKETQYDLYWRYKHHEIDLWEVFQVAKFILKFNQDQAIALAISCLVVRDIPRELFPHDNYQDWIMNNTYCIKAILDERPHGLKLIDYFDEALAHDVFKV